MLKNYLKVSLRNLIKNKGYSAINIFGLAFGVSCVFLIVQYLQKEFSYDTFHTQSENIYRVVWASENPQTRTPHPMAQALVHDFPEVESAVSITPLWGPGLTRQTFSIKNIEKNIQFDETAVLAVDSTFFKVFSFKLLKGNINAVLRQPKGILLSASAAKKYFGNEEPMGKYLSINDDNVLIEVIGVFKDVPESSHFHFDFLVSYALQKAIADPKSEFYTWKDFGHYNYVRLKPGTNAQALESKLISWLPRYVDWSPASFAYLKENSYGFKLQPITDIHLKSDLRWELEGNGNIEYVYMLMAAALLILIIATINFINLTTAQSVERAKEIGIRKSMGAFRRQLVLQFTGESVMIALCSILISIVFIELSLPLFNGMTNNNVSLNITSLLFLFVGMGLFIGLLAGIYPSFYLSAIKPTEVLKGKMLQSPKGNRLRNFFTVFQFSASMILICSTTVIYFQLDSIKHKSLGFTKEEVIVIPVKNRALSVDVLLDELSKIPGITLASAASNIPGETFNQNGVFASAKPDHEIDASEMAISYDLLAALQIPLAAGRDFKRTNPADLEHAFIINETAAKNLNLSNAVGQEITWQKEGEPMKGEVIGVVKDFNFQSLHQAVKPLLITLRKDDFNYVIVKTSTHDFSSIISAIETTWKKFDNRFDFQYSFLSTTVDQQYTAEERMSTVLIAFSATAILIACMGLLGIAALTFRTRTKEISVRKVLGAELPGLIFLLLKDFSRLILVSIVIATPVTVWLMHTWLENFSYRITLNPLIFIGSGLMLMVIAWLSLIYLTYSVTKVNPAITLKSE